MTKEEILEGNKLIAEFMGGIYVRREDLFDSHIIEEIIYNNNHPILKNNIKTTEHLYHLRYHLSWDWLMSVVDKIENDLHDSFNVDIVNKNQCEIVRNGNEFICGYGFETVYHSKIKAVYYSVVEFIKWYNLCQKIS